MLRPLKRIPLGESAYREIRQSIIYGRFPPGEPLGEASLADQLQTSRGPIREALGRLEAEGLLINRPHRGMVVREFSAEDIVSLYGARVAIETAAVRLCISLRSPTTPLQRIVDQMRASARSDDIEALTEWEFEFHRTLCLASHNRHLTEIFDSLTAQIQMVLALDNKLHASRAPLADFAHEHQELIDVLERGDERNAIEKFERHIIAGVGELVMRHLAKSETVNIGDLANLLLGPRDMFLAEVRMYEKGSKVPKSDGGK